MHEIDGLLLLVVYESTKSLFGFSQYNIPYNYTHKWDSLTRVFILVAMMVRKLIENQLSSWSVHAAIRQVGRTGSTTFPEPYPNFAPKRCWEIVRCLGCSKDRRK